MDGGGAFGGVKAGSQVDPMSYLRKPSVVFRIGALVSRNTYQYLCQNTHHSSSNKWATCDLINNLSAVQGYFLQLFDLQVNFLVLQSWERNCQNAQWILHPSSFILHPSSFILLPASCLVPRLKNIYQALV